MKKIKAGVFSCPQILQLFKKPQFVLAVSDDEKADWNAFRHVTVGFLGNANAVNFRKLLGDLITSYEKLGCSMSLKMHFLHSNLDSFLVNCGAASDEYGEGFHLDISAKKNRYKSKRSAAISTDYCYVVRRDALEIQCKRQAKRRLP